MTFMVTFDFSKSGFQDGRLASFQEEVQKSHEHLERERKTKAVGFWDLPFDAKMPKAVAAFADTAQKRFKTLLVLGIGGSSQGLKALAPVLDPAGFKPRLQILENPDPAAANACFENLDWKTTLVNVVSKSGNTVETLALFEECRKHLPGKDQIVVTTGDNNGLLCKWAKKEDLTFFEIPENVGGRFSVFSAVGLLPLAFAGADVMALLKGAQNGAGRFQTALLKTNPVYQNGLIHFLTDRSGKNISVLMPYAECLEEFGRWYAQLWAESLGKGGKGQTPLVAVGPRDQHSLAQLFLDGPRDKIVTLLKFEEDRKTTLGSLLHKEYNATAEALQEAGVPVVGVTLPKRDGASMGELMIAYEIQTAFTGHLMGLNPYDQPAVEKIKKRIH